MPTQTVAQVEAYAHCTQPRCPGYREEAVRGVRTEDAYTYAERGGDLPGIESSFVYLTFANEEEIPCPHCGRPRDISPTSRPQYANLSGFAQDGLLDVEPFDAAKQVEVAGQPVRDDERESMLTEIAELRGMVTALLGQSKPPEEPEGD
jgi:hypothetical protein